MYTIGSALAGTVNKKSASEKVGVASAAATVSLFLNSI
jgi:hypothetical protein